MRRDNAAFRPTRTHAVVVRQVDHSRHGAIPDRVAASRCLWSGRGVYVVSVSTVRADVSGGVDARGLCTQHSARRPLRDATEHGARRPQSTRRHFSRTPTIRCGHTTSTLAAVAVVDENPTPAGHRSVSVTHVIGVMTIHVVIHVVIHAVICAHIVVPLHAVTAPVVAIVIVTAAADHPKCNKRCKHQTRAGSNDKSCCEAYMLLRWS